MENDASGKSRSITANQLRWLAEHADGERAKLLSVVRKGNGLDLVDAATATTADQQSLFNVFTPWEGEGGLKGPRQSIEIKIDGRTVLKKTTKDDGELPDAFFLTQSAVDKFVLPYYTRFKHPAQIDAMRRELFRAPNVLVEHIPPSISDAIALRAYPVPGPGSADTTQFTERDSDAPEAGSPG